MRRWSLSLSLFIYLTRSLNLEENWRKPPTFFVAPGVSEEEVEARIDALVAKHPIPEDYVVHSPSDARIAVDTGSWLKS